MKKFNTLLVICLAFATTTWGQLLQFNTFGNTGTETSEASVANDPNVAASTITQGAGVTPAGNANRFGGSAWFDVGDTNPTTLAESVAGNDYLEFMVTPLAGFTFTPTDLTFSWQRSGTGPNAVTLRSSADGFAADLGSATFPTTNLTAATITIAGLTNLAAPTTFRLYGYGATAAAGTGGFDIAANTVNVVLNGTTAVLPVELVSFTARYEYGQVECSFTTATETNNAYFSIERSQDGARFEAIGKVTGAGTSTTKHEYTYTDERPLKGINFYRLRQVDFDGQFSYSPVVSVSVGKIGGVRLSPQPVLDRLNVALDQPTVEAAVWQVYDFSGRLLQSGTVQAESTNFEISTVALTEGAYVLRLVNGQQIITQQFQKN